MRRGCAVEAEVAGRRDDPPAEVVVPDPVDHHPRRQRIGRIGDPARQRSAALGLGGPGIEHKRRLDGGDRRRAAPPAPSWSGRRGPAGASGRAGVNVPA